VLHATFLFVLLPIGAFVFWLFSDRNQRWQASLRAWYSARWLPFQFRIFIANAPIWAFGLAFIGLVFVVPRDLTVWVVVGWAGIFMVALSLGYWAHMRFMPAWLRDEVVRGEIEAPTPDRWDWLLYWFFVIGLLSLVILVLFRPFGT
jgi:hypothetical protein